MTTMTHAAPTAPATGQQALRVTQPRVLLSEWTKFRSLRSTMWTLLTAVVLTIGIGALFSAVTANQYHTFSAADKASFNPITTSLNGILFSQLAIGVLGVLLISGEYSTGMIRSSLTAVPRRLPVLWAKLGVFAGVVFSVILVTSFVSFFLGQALLNSHHLGVSISAPDALRDPALHLAFDHHRLQYDAAIIKRGVRREMHRAGTKRESDQHSAADHARFLAMRSPSSPCGRKISTMISSVKAIRSRN